MKKMLLALSLFLLQEKVIAQEVDLSIPPETTIGQNKIADQEGLKRFVSLKSILRSKREGVLKALPLNAEGVEISSELSTRRRFAMPEAVSFIKTAGSFVSRFLNNSLIVNSCVRDAGTQRALRRHKGKQAAKATGPARSLHLTGAACDFSEKNFSFGERNSFRNWLDGFQRAGQIMVTEHGNGVKHFHIFVLKNFDPTYIPLPEPIKLPVIEIESVKEVALRF